MHLESHVKRVESAREQRIALYKSDQQHRNKTNLDACMFVFI